MKRLLHCAAVAMFGASPAFATFYCEVIEGSAALHAASGTDSELIETLPEGAIVSLFDEVEDKVGEWVRVAYDEEGAGPWGAGVVGWMLEARLSFCG